MGTEEIRNAIKDNDVGARRTTAVSRSWRRSASWLNDLEQAKTQEEKDDAFRKLLYYRHHAHPQLNATKEQLEGFAGFEAWRSILKRERLQSSVWIECFAKCAVSNAEAQERAAQQAALCKWTEWIHDGPADGLRRQHQFSRGSDGWTPTKPCPGNVEPIDESDGLILIA